MARSPPKFQTFGKYKPLTYRQYGEKVSIKMKIAVFAAKRHTAEGKAFFSYIGRITKKDGEVLTVQVKFRESCGNPDGNKCPMIIVANKSDCNLSQRTITTTSEETGETITKTVYTLWVTAYTTEEYVDHSLDDIVTE